MAHRQENRFLLCDIFTVTVRGGFKFQIELQSETGEFLASTESESGFELKARAAWATAHAKKLAEVVREDGKLIKFSVRQWTAQFEVPDLDMGDLLRETDSDLRECFRHVGEQKLVAQLGHDYILANRYTDLYNQLLAEQSRREDEAKRDQLLDALIWIEAPNGPTISESAESGDWNKVFELIRPFAMVSESAKKVLGQVRAAAGVRSLRGLSSAQHDTIADAVICVKRFERAELPTLLVQAEECLFGKVSVGCNSVVIP